VEGGSDGVVSSLGVVLRLEVEVREGTTSAASERRRKHGAGEKNPVGGGSTLLKGAVGHNGGGGGRGSRATCGGARGGGPWLPPVGDSSGGAARPAAARPRRACPHSGVRRRVADERVLYGSGRARRREARGTRGPAGEGNGVGRARMNSDDF
jgi:hypothetical protein